MLAPAQRLATTLAPCSVTATWWSQLHMSQLVVPVLLVALVTMTSAILVFGQPMLVSASTQVTGCCCAGTNCPCHHYAVPVPACYICYACATCYGYYCCGTANRTSLSGPIPSSPSYTCTSCMLFALSPAIVSWYASNTFAGTNCMAVQSGMTIPVPSAIH